MGQNYIYETIRGFETATPPTWDELFTTTQLSFTTVLPSYLNTKPRNYTK